MTTSRLLRFTAILLVGLLPYTAMALDEPHTLRLLGHSSLENPGLELDERDWRWLRERRVLVMGVSAPDYAPFDLSNNNDFEGITADYAWLIGLILSVPIEVRRYDTRDEVIEALKRGEVDLVGSANGYEAADKDLILSRSYANDQPVLVTRAGDSHLLSATWLANAWRCFTTTCNQALFKPITPTRNCCCMARPTKPSAPWRSARQMFTWATLSVPVI